MEFRRVLFRSKMIGKPWIRIISCSENEVADPDIPPHLSGCGENDKACFYAFESEFLKQVKPAHDRFNKFLPKVGHPDYKLSSEALSVWTHVGSNVRPGVPPNHSKKASNH